MVDYVQYATPAIQMINKVFVSKKQVKCSKRLSTYKMLTELSQISISAIESNPQIEIINFLKYSEDIINKIQCCTDEYVETNILFLNNEEDYWILDVCHLRQTFVALHEQYEKKCYEPDIFTNNVNEFRVQLINVYRDLVQLTEHKYVKLIE